MMKTDLLTNYQKQMLFFSCFIVVIGLMAIDFINPSLPYIMKTLHASQSAVKGLMAVYMMALGLAQFFYGSFSDWQGRRRAILLAFFIAIPGFLLSAASSNLFMLYCGRFLTALGTAGCPVIARAIIADICKGQTQLRKAFSYFSMASQLSPAIAPVIGGAIQQYTNWHWAFVALTAINLLTAAMIFYYMPESHQELAKKKSLIQQIRSYLALFLIPRFMIFNFLSALIFVFSIGFYSLSPFIFHIIGFSPIENGLFYIIYAAGIVLGALTLATILAEYDSKKTFLIVLISYILLFIIATGIFKMFPKMLPLIIGFSFLLSFICGIAAPLTLSLCMQGFNIDKGAASAVQSFIKMFFTGAALLAFNFIELQNFSTLATIFLIISFIILGLFLLERKINC